MTQSDAQDKADRLFKTKMTLRKKNGVCIIDRPDGTPAGYGPSWIAALRFAARPFLDAQQKDQEQLALKRRQEEAAARKEAAEFADFLREHLAEAYEAWRAKNVPEPVTEENAVPAAVQEAADGTPADPV